MTTASRIVEMILRQPDLHSDARAGLTPNSHFRDLGMDDMMLLDLSYAIEEEFSIVFDADQFEFETVNELIAVVEGKLADKLPRAAVA